MPRQRRIVLPGYVYHITQRGNHKEAVFHENQDNAVYLKYLQTYREKYGLKIFAFCLMGNHVHFIASPLQVNSLSLTFKMAHQRYAMYFHKKTERDGHLWQGRFYSCLLLGRHLYEAIRYVEKNPVRANLVDKAWNYPWSSANAHLGKEYKAIDLADIREIIDVADWGDYLMKKDNERFIKLIRTCTFKEKPMGPKSLLEALEKKFKIGLILKKRGRPLK